MDDRFVNLGEEVMKRERERERDWVTSQQRLSEIVLIVACLQTHTSIITVSVTRLCSPLGLELMVKLRTLLTVFTLILKPKARDYAKGCYISDAWGVRPITMHCVSWPIRADCACRKEGLCRKWCVWERRGIEDMYSIWKRMCFLNIKSCQHILLHQIHQIIIFKKASYDPFKVCFNIPL